MIPDRPSAPSVIAPADPARPRKLSEEFALILREFEVENVTLRAVLLLLPLPVPFSNTVPAWGVMLIAGGLLERDGIFIIAGYLASIAAVAYFAIIGFAGREAFDFIWKWFER